MTAHKHAAMIKAKADNMDLVVFKNDSDGTGWYETDEMPISESEFSEYFLCLPQHKAAVLNLLNGGKSEVVGSIKSSECELPDGWSSSWWYMSDAIVSRVKPRKEKRWVVVDEKGKAVPTLIKDEDSLDNAKQLMSECSFHEIEVEV